LIRSWVLLEAWKVLVPLGTPPVVRLSLLPSNNSFYMERNEQLVICQLVSKICLFVVVFTVLLLEAIQFCMEVIEEGE
ncbi:hypothetical protein DND62_31105, partial [Pseudomonas syringae pv. pisi]